MSASLCFLTAVLTLTGPNDSRSPTGSAKIAGCVVSLIKDIDVPAQEAGVLVELEAEEGMHVEEGTLLARVNDSKPQAAKRVAEAELKVSLEEAQNDINVRFSKESARVAEYEYRMHIEANKKNPGVTPKTEMEKLRLTWNKGVLQIEQATMERKVAALTSEAKQAQVDAAEDDISRRQIVAPLSGEIVEVKPHLGEWVNPGDMVLRIVQLDRLRVEGWVLSSDYAPAEIINRAVRIQVPLERGRTETFDGKIVFVEPSVGANGEYQVWAEVENRQENGQWLLLPGKTVDMTIVTALAATKRAKPTGSGRKVGGRGRTNERQM